MTVVHVRTVTSIPKSPFIKQIHNSYFDPKIDNHIAYFSPKKDKIKSYFEQRWDKLHDYYNRTNRWILPSDSVERAEAKEDFQNKAQNLGYKTEFCANCTSRWFNCDRKSFALSGFALNIPPKYSIANFINLF